MGVLIEFIRKAVVLVLVMEVLLWLQPGKNYGPYLKMLVGIMVVYSLVGGIFDVFGKFGKGIQFAFPEYAWTGDWSIDDLDNEAEDTTETAHNTIEIEQIDIPIQQIEIGKIALEGSDDVP